MNYNINRADTVSLFTIFLKKRRAFKRHQSNLCERPGPGIMQVTNIKELVDYVEDRHMPIDELVDRSFVWSNTPQGNGYWQQLDTEWREEVLSIKRKTTDYDSIW